MKKRSGGGGEAVETVSSKEVCACGGYDARSVVLFCEQ